MSHAQGVLPPSTSTKEPSARRPRLNAAGAFVRVRDFLAGIGIDVVIDPQADGFLDGLLVQGSGIRVRSPSDILAGDLLHEAGHVAVTPSLFRGQLDCDSSSVSAAMDRYLDEHPGAMSCPEDPVARAILQSGESEAIAWSYAAACACGIDSRLPFAKGFSGGGREVHRMLEAGRHLGIHGLAAGGMTELPRRDPVRGFPAMKRWMQI